MADFCMPSLGADMDDGVLVEWKVKVGDRVSRGDIVAVVQTQKAAIEVEIFHTGVIESLVVEEGQQVPVGTTLATVKVDGEQEKTVVRATNATAEPRAQPTAKRPRRPQAPSSPPRRASPAARRRARELGVDLDALPGDRPIRLADVEAASQTTPAAKKPTSTTESAKARIAALRAATGAAMSRSKREIPHYYLAHTVDVGASMAWLAERNREVPPAKRLLPAALVLKSIALALGKFPELNGFWRDDQFEAANAVHLGVAISIRGGGVVAPAIHNADELSLPALMEKFRDLVARARASRLRSSELSDGTATVSSLGDSGVDTVYGVIYPPQVSLVGVGAIRERAWAEGGMLAAREVVNLTLAADHRASEGHRGSLFLRQVGDYLAAPETL